MKRTGARRTLVIGIVMAVLASLVALAAGCSAINRDAVTSEDAATVKSSPPVTYGDGRVAGGAPATTDGDGTTGDDYLYSPDAALSAVKPGANPAQDQLVIRNGSLRVRVKDIDGTVTKIRSVTTSFGGVIEDLQISTETDQPVYRTLSSGESVDVVPLGAYVTIRVPGDRLDALTKKVAGFGTVLRQWSNQTDVTQQHIDLTARLKNLRAEESRLRDFLKAAKDVKEMLLVETELSRVRGEIESQQAQLDYLDRQISYATLSVELVKPAAVVRPTTGTDWGFSDAITRGIQGAANALLSIITVSIAVLPILVIALAAYFVIRLVVRRSRRSRAAVDADDAIGADDLSTFGVSGADDLTHDESA